MLIRSQCLISSSRLVCHSLSVALPAISRISRACATYRQTQWATTCSSRVDAATVLRGTVQLPAADVDGSLDHDTQQQNRELFRYRTQFPVSMWHHIAGLLQSQPFPTAVDMGFAAVGAQETELQQLGFRVAEAVPPGPHDHPAAYPRLPAGCSDIVTCLPGPTSPHASVLVTEARRLLCKGGYLAVGWNDRDISNQFVMELESLLESINPDYCRASKQHNPPSWTKALADGTSLKLVSFSRHPHSLVMARCATLQDLLGGLACVRSHLAASSATRKFFHREVRALVERYFDPDQPFDLPLVTKLYVLRKMTSVATQLDCLAAATAEQQQTASICTAVVDECGACVMPIVAAVDDKGSDGDDDQEAVMQPLRRSRRQGSSLHF